MLTVQAAPFFHDQIIKALEGYNENGVSFKHTDSAGMDIHFDVTGTDEDPKVIAKAYLKKAAQGVMVSFK
ncbi:hypothetical protein EQG49_08340 [Periweissella cryptocerci]|uniref:Uncharacterized protein n=1 Tax=Periweissella cryptocerci TaxID=2506420 RepID=A0A4P6YUL2_9LACO|nr:hypothetical protein [Periweissella cryptocerci]QBO36479.1 hypothetical protein EQG49_08340 [Periweissella cryptocerci]